METNQMDQPNLRNTGELPPQKSGGFSLKNMRLQTRLVLLVMVISIPILIGSNLFLAARTASALRNHTNEQIQQINESTLEKTDLLLQTEAGVLTQMSALNEITGMDPVKQKPVLEKTAAAFNKLFVLHTTDLTGMNLARSDNEALKNFSDRGWFKNAIAGAPISQEVLITRTTNQASVNFSMPVRDASNKIVGVISLVSNLSDVSKKVLISKSGSTVGGITTFVVDKTDRVIAHTDEKVSSSLADYKTYPPVVAMRAGTRGIYQYTDGQGREWWAFISTMDNGWGIISQVEAAKALTPVYLFWGMTASVMALGAVLMLVAAVWFIRQSLRPVQELTRTAAAIAAGDLTREVKVSQLDEVGILARAFNEMTAQLRESIMTLEQRVDERTRAVTLSVDVSRHLASILDLDSLTRQVVEEIKQSFNYYHVHIYLFDDDHQNLVMVGGTGEAGKVMLARGHKIEAGKGLVGRAAAGNQSVLVSDTLQDPSWLPNPLLPETKSELAVPIAVGSQVLGVLDVQQNTAGALAQSDKDLLEAVANQVAIAVQNARAFQTTRQEAERQSFVSSVGQRIQSAVSIDEVLQIAVSELGRTLGAQHSSVELRSQASAEDRKN